MQVLLDSMVELHFEELLVGSFHGKCGLLLEEVQPLLDSMVDSRMKWLVDRSMESLSDSRLRNNLVVDVVDCSLELVEVVEEVVVRMEEQNEELVEVAQLELPGEGCRCG